MFADSAVELYVWILTSMKEFFKYETTRHIQPVAAGANQNCVLQSEGPEGDTLKVGSLTSTRQGYNA